MLEDRFAVQSTYIKSQLELPWTKKTSSVVKVTYRKLPVRSVTPGDSTVSAKKFAPRLTSLRQRFQPCTPPAVMGCDDAG